MRKSILIIFHIVFWLVIWSLNFSFNLLSPNPQTISNILIRAFTLLMYTIDFYIVYLILIPVFFNKKKYLEFSIYTLIFCLLYTLLFTYLYSIVGTAFGFRVPEKLFSPGMFTDFYYIVLYIILGAFVRFSVDGFKYLRLKAQLEKQNLASELALLRSQVNPHFLFNTLNNIHSMIHGSPKKAEDSIIKLSGIMRYMLYDSNTELVPLEKEISFLKSYISLLQLRIKKINFIETNISENFGNIKIAPMLLVPFVENAYKHGDKSVAIPGININLRIEGKTIFFDVENFISDSEINEKDSTSGIGLTNIKRRLELIYTDKYKLNIEDKHNSFIVKLEISTV
ncbi:sensor histidine kinase [Bacteroidota bacterium]